MVSKIEMEIVWSRLDQMALDPTLFTPNRSNEVSRILKMLPSEKWRSKSRHSQMTFLHYAILLDDVHAVCSLLQIMEMEYINAQNRHGRNAVWIAASLGKTYLLQLLMSCGAKYLFYHYKFPQGPLSAAIEHGQIDCKRVLGSNGVQLCYGICENCWECNFNRGVRRCRDAIVVLLGLKKRRRYTCKGNMSHTQVFLPKLDRFLIQQELAVAIWSTRYTADKDWQ